MKDKISKEHLAVAQMICEIGKQFKIANDRILLLSDYINENLQTDDELMSYQTGLVNLMSDFIDGYCIISSAFEEYYDKL